MDAKRKVNLVDVAVLAGVSRAAAAKVLNGGSAQIRVGAETRKRIIAAARELDYRPHVAASILAGGKSRLLGIFLDSFSHYRTLRLLQEIERLCSERSCRIIASFTHDNIANMREDYYALQRYGVGGFICCAHSYPDLQKEVAELFTGAEDVVFLEKPCVPGMPYVRTSQVKAMTAMIADARGHGYRKIGVLHGQTTQVTERTLHAEFLQAMAENGLRADENLIFEYPKSVTSPQVKIKLAMEQMILPMRPDFLFVDDAVSAVILRHELLKMGLKLTIYGGNNEPLFQSVDVVSFDPDYGKMASELLKLLFNPETRREVPVVEAIYKEGMLF